MRITSWTHRVKLAADTVSVSEARLFVRDRLRDHGLAQIEGDVQLVVSERATNALTHAHTAFTVTLHGDGLLVVLTVEDGSSEQPTVLKVEAMAPGGRGMLIVEMLSQDWGCVERPGAAKSVWATFALPPAS
jgi:anti-sigma regulatory factor (Ser/Thr protein kinase)